MLALTLTWVRRNTAPAHSMKLYPHSERLTTLSLTVFTQSNFVADFHFLQVKCNFIRKTATHIHLRCSSATQYRREWSKPDYCTAARHRPLCRRQLITASLKSTGADLSRVPSCSQLELSPVLLWSLDLLQVSDQSQTVLSYGLEVKREYYQNCSVLGCVTQCSQSAAHSYEQFLQVQQIGFVTLGPLRHA